MSAGGTLSETLVSALADSASLIVLCSPDAARSPWVELEVKEFRRVRPDGKILPILAAVNTSGLTDVTQLFPPALLTALPGLETGNGPLVPNIGKLGLRTAALKIIAALLLGLRFDDLHNRDRRRNQRVRTIVTAIVGCVAALLAILATLALNSTNEAQQERRQKQLVESEQLSLLSQQALKDGAVSLAARMALRALPSPGNPRPTLWHAEVALNNAYQRLTEHFYLATGNRHSLLAVQRPDKPRELLTVNAAGEFTRWDIGTQRPLSTLRPQSKVEISDARLVAGLDGVLASDKSGKLYWWDVAAHTLVERKMNDEVRSISPDSSGHQAVVLSALAKAPMPQATLISLPGLTTIRELPIPRGIVPQYAHLSTQLQLLSLVGNDVGVSRYLNWISDLKGMVIHRLPDGAEMAFNSFTSPDGDKLFILHGDGQVTAAKVKTGQVLFETKVADIPSTGAYDASTNTLAIGTDQGKIELCELDFGLCRLIANENPAGFFSLSFSADGATVFGAAYQGAVGGWYRRAPNEAMLLQTDPFRTIMLARAADGTYKLREGPPPTQAVQVANRATADWKRAQGYSSVMHLSPDGLLLAVGSANGYVSVLDASQAVPQLIASAWLGDSDVGAIHFDKGRTRLFAGLSSGDLFAWEFRSPQAPVKWFHGGGRVIGIEACGSEGLLAGFSDGAVVALEGTATSKPLVATGWQISAMSCSAASPPTLLLADIHGDGWLYSPLDGKLKLRLAELGRTYPPHPNSIRALLRADGIHAAIMGSDNRLRLWNTTSRMLISNVAMKNDGFPGPLAFDQDGRLAYADDRVAHVLGRDGVSTLIDTYPIQHVRFVASQKSGDLLSLSDPGYLRQWTVASAVPYAYTDLPRHRDANLRGTELLMHPDGKRIFALANGQPFILSVLPHGDALPAAVRRQLPPAAQQLNDKDLDRYHIRPDVLSPQAAPQGFFANIGEWLMPYWQHLNPTPSW